MLSFVPLKKHDLNLGNCISVGVNLSQGFESAIYSNVPLYYCLIFFAVASSTLLLAGNTNVRLMYLFSLCQHILQWLYSSVHSIHSLNIVIHFLDTLKWPDCHYGESVSIIDWFWSSGCNANQSVARSLILSICSVHYHEGFLRQHDVANL